MEFTEKFLTEKLDAGDVFFTSDTHFGHQNIIKYCDRPFKDTDQMDEVIIKRWNETVPVDGIVYHLGDIALGEIAKSLPKVGRLNGYKVAIMGNHDRPFMRAGKADEVDWIRKYEQVFQSVLVWDEQRAKTPYAYWIEREGKVKLYNMSHFPYSGDHTPEDRHSEMRPVDNENVLIHGHTHSTDRLTFSNQGTAQVHVGQDAWDFRPVHLSQIDALLGD